MNKTFYTTLSTSIFTTSAIAGSVSFNAPVSPALVEEQAGAMGGSGMWLIPLLAIALIFLVMNKPASCGSLCD